jgi:hypothetical protein
MHLEAIIKRVWGCTWRHRSSKIGGVVEHSQYGGCTGQEGGRYDGNWESNHWLTFKWAKIDI